MTGTAANVAEIREAEGTVSGGGNSGIVGGKGESDLPEGWARATLGELGVEVQPGFASGKHNRDGNGVLHLRPMNITRRGVIDISDARFIEDESERRVQHGDILFNNTNSPALVGKTAWVNSDEPLAYSNHMTRLRPPEGVDSQFLAIQLHALWSNGYFKAVLNNHVNQASVPRKALLETTIAIPPLPEQHRIVAKLNEQLAHVESGVASLEAAVTLRRSLRDSLLDRYVLGRGEGPAPESLQSITQHKSAKFNYRLLPPLPRGWYWRIAKEICPLITSGATPEASLMHSGSGEIPFLKVYNINKQGEVDFSIRPTFVDRAVHEGKLKKSRILPGDVLTNIVGPPLGKSAVVPDTHEEWNINQAIVAFRAGGEILPDWLRFVLLSPYVINLLVATARATAGQFNIALSTCRELPIPVPPMPVQERLCGYLRSELSRLDLLNREVDVIASMPDGLRAALLHAAFTGTLVPQDPTDEPASALLDRIRAQRSAAASAKSTRRRTPRTSKSAGDPGQGELPL
ncbi:restriction endonuclease subunit S [Streptomyces cyaneofuscatus]|uniref:restriction endonuclease subunit S n=1 Tax=Streptomyces cyaneofuscatus TaxID=66883 RepID=UPI00295598A0|nr:restriction endonuclease subunit S [Streptomyces cyaneofuscatus]WOP09156.1 restriction endonuclease subunit S [Streptomyces cyaneofuscatus]